MIKAAASGELQALVVGGVDVRDFDEPAAVREALDAVPFLVSLEVRASDITDRADVVLPVAPAVEKNGTIILRAQFAEEQLTDADHLEVVCFVGGG